MATIKEVARRAGVSVGTVSNVLSNLPTVTPELKKRVEKAISQLQYRPNQIARSLKKQSTQTLGLVISDITNPFFPSIVRGAEDEAAAHGFMLSIFNTDDQPDKEARVLETLEDRRVDGVLLVPALRRSSNVQLRRLMESGTPVLCIDREIEDEDLQSFPIDSVLVDNRGGVEIGMAHLLDAGARRIAFLGGPPTQYIARERYAGYERALRKRNLSVERSLVWGGDFRKESAYRAVLENYPGTCPDGLFVANILMALGAVQALEELNVAIPKQIQVVNFDHVELLESFHPRLSCVAQPIYEIGRQAVQTMLTRLKNRAAPRQRIVLATRWKQGESTK